MEGCGETLQVVGISDPELATKEMLLTCIAIATAQESTIVLEQIGFISIKFKNSPF